MVKQLQTNESALKSLLMSDIIVQGLYEILSDWDYATNASAHETSQKVQFI